MGAYFDWQSSPPEQILTERFHITTGFHPGQQEIIEQLIQGKRVLAIQRTGWGKSLCYQMASLYYPNLTLVFSPLKALMRDQCQRCNDTYNIAAAIVSSDFTDDENKLTLTKAIAGDLKILFIAPERLVNNDWQKYVLQMRISMVVIDEAHCISTWGHDFRPDYRRIFTLLNAFPRNTPVLALTATANKRVEQDILEQIGSEALIVRGTMHRPNLRLNVVTMNGDHDKLHYLANLLPLLPGTGIIYCATRDSTKMVATFLRLQNINAEYYHADRDTDEKQDIEQKLMNNQYKVVCSTNALGMGIDKPDIGFVIHYHFPASPIHYYQEIGRAGRNGSAAYCILLYDPIDVAIQERFVKNAKPQGKYYSVVLATLRQHYSTGLREKDILLATGVSSQKAIRIILADLIDQQMVEKNGNIYSATRLLQQIDFSSYDSMLQHKLHELEDMQKYALIQTCFMDYLSVYLGDTPGYQCKACRHCLPSLFPVVNRSKRMSIEVAQFLEEKYLPYIEKRGEKNFKHEEGWSLSFHGGSSSGQLVRQSKYENGGPFAEELVLRAVQVIRERYPLEKINGIVSVPPTKSGKLVEVFARRIADMLHIRYLPVLVKVRSTEEQKNFTNAVQKEHNVKNAFSIHPPQSCAGYTLLLIDDIYDSGYTLRAAAKALRKDGALTVYPFTITRTLHSDDQ